MPLSSRRGLRKAGRIGVLAMRRLAFLSVPLLMATAAIAQEARDLRPYAPGTPHYGTGGSPQNPSTAVLRQDEDWRWLRDTPLSDRSTIDRLRYAPLTPDEPVFATFGFEGRLGFESFNNGSFGDQPGHDLSWHLRANLYAGLTFGERLRLFGALKFGQVEGSDFSVPTADDDGPDIHQAFVELSFGDAFGLEARDLFVRLGRQELHYGSGRLISIRNGPNVRNDFDGVLARAAVGKSVTDVFAFKPTEDEPGPFNNGTDHSQALWGVYTTMPLGLFPGGNLDLFYVGFDREVSPYSFQTAPIDETRHTVGARVWSGGPPTDGWGYDIEGGLQFGTARGLAGQDGDIRAGYLAGSVSYGLSQMAWSPVVSLRFGISSGDSDPSDGKLGTFRAPFPPGRYFGEANPLGPGNLAGLSPSISVSPTDKLTLTARYDAFWRVETADGIYGPPQFPVRGTSGGERFVGHEIALSADYRINDVLSLSATAAHFKTGDYLRANGPDDDITFIQIKLNASF